MIQYCMGKARYRSPLYDKPNEWLSDDSSGTYEYGDYRHCYLTIRRLKNGMYQPAIGAFTDIPYPGHDLPSSGRFEYETLDQAKKHLFEYVDYIRDVYDKESMISFRKNLHNMNPEVYPAI